MSFVHNAEYNAETNWTEDQLNSIRPNDIARFFLLEAYGKEDVGEGDRPGEKRGNTLKAYKNKISMFMLSGEKWNATMQTGNPTQSKAVNNVLNRVFRFEARGEGKSSKATRAFTLAEVEQLLQLASNVRSLEKASRFRAIILTQWQLIARIKEIQQVVPSDFKTNDAYPEAIFVQLRWLKNQRKEERPAPTQIILPSMDASLCAVTAIAIHLETFFSAMTPDATKGKIFGQGLDSDAQWAQGVLRSIINMESFTPTSNESGILGTHGL